MIDEYIGKKYGLLTVLSYSHKSGGHFIYQCSCECGGNVRKRRDDLERGQAVSCGCKSAVKKNNRVLLKTVNPVKVVLVSDGKAEITQGWWESKKKNAEARGKKFTITPEYALEVLRSQGYKCYYTDIDLVIKRGKKGNASIDRIDSSKEYEPGNIQWVDKRVNFMKQSYSHEVFVELCNKTAAKHSLTSTLKVLEYSNKGETNEHRPKHSRARPQQQSKYQLKFGF